jgi:hypothetical protein
MEVYYKSYWLLVMASYKNKHSLLSEKLFLSFPFPVGATIMMR